ncbi:hypothetical protein MRBBS_3599 [Marinobacter sp. BSs20148]|nr:hypothetical protein MRBBS_3599 [Marinobacter sp. BSs20148]
MVEVYARQIRGLLMQVSVVACTDYTGVTSGVGCRVTGGLEISR